MRASVRTGVNAKRLGQMSTAVYARLGSPAKIVNVIIIKFKIKLKKKKYSHHFFSSYYKYIY